MRTRLCFSPCAAFLLLLVLPSLFAAKPPAGEDIFRDCVIPDVELEIPREGIRSLQQSPRKYVLGTVREGKTLYTNVAVRLKGGPGSFRGLDQDKQAFTLNFDKFAPGQTFHGLKKIHLNNSVQDGSFMHEKISREIFEAAGVPVPRAGNAWVTFNGTEQGMYVLLEGVNKQFLKRYFKDVSGTVHDGHSGNDVNQSGWRDISSGEKFVYEQSRLRDVASAARTYDLDERLAALEKVLDLERFFSFLAVELILGHWDGYTKNRNNFRIYHDKDANRMVFIPHGLDQTFGRLYPIFPEETQALVTRAVLEIPEARKRYRERYAQIATNVFDPAWITNRINLAATSIDEAFARHNEASPQLGNAFSRRIRNRALALAKQVDPAAYEADQNAVALKFNGIGVAPLTNPTNWLPKIDLGKADLKQESAEGNTLLHIRTEEGCTASWRTVLQLPPGSYRFQAHIRTKDVVLDPADPRAGAGLRMSRTRVGQKNSGDNSWAPATFDFEVSEEARRTELVCELRAKKGEIWYDLSSLKVIRK